MNRLQQLNAQADYFVSLNPTRPPRDAEVVHHAQFTHPVYEPGSVATHGRLADLNGRRRTWYCGAYFRNGFHEDAIASGARVAADFGVQL